MVLDGMRETLKSTANLSIMMEFAPIRLEAGGYDPLELLNGFSDQGFQMYDIIARQRNLKPSTPLEVFERLARAERVYANLFLERTVPNKTEAK
jgi:hypothetical protein